jgi:chaperonin cofactor prefoldin
MTPEEVENRVESLELAVNILLQEIASIREELKDVRRGDD